MGVWISFSCSLTRLFLAACTPGKCQQYRVGMREQNLYDDRPWIPQGDRLRVDTPDDCCKICRSIPGDTFFCRSFFLSAETIAQTSRRSKIVFAQQNASLGHLIYFSPTHT